MKTIQANSVGSCWRADVAYAAKFDYVNVVDLNGNTLGMVSTRDSSAKGSNHYYLNHKRISYANLWEEMHKWSDVISKQQKEAYALHVR